MSVADRLAEIGLELIVLQNSYRKDQVQWFALGLAVEAVECARRICERGHFDAEPVEGAMRTLVEVWIGRA